MEMDVKGVSQCPEPIPHSQGSGGCQQQQQQQDGQAGESATASDSNNPEKRQNSEKEDKKAAGIGSEHSMLDSDNSYPEEATTKSEFIKDMLYLKTRSNM